MKRVLKWTAIVLVTLLLVTVGGATWWVSRSLPETEGEITLKPLQQNVKVTRDSVGVPHIEAKNEADLYFAQGYIQAQDRLFQMDLSRRQASGRLSEVIGKATVDRDKFFRTFGLRRAAEASWPLYNEQAKRVLQSFTAGVNAYIAELRESGKWPIEFTILGYEPEKWTPVDSLTIGKYMAYDLGGHWDDQAFLSYLLQKFPKDKAYELFPSYPKEAPTIVGLDIEKAFASAPLAEPFNGSNDWVVSGKKTKSGKPLLADDPHLSLSTPSIWYQMHLKAPTVNVSGVIFAGIPGIILGHNESVAWGVTNVGPDVQDLYIEKRQGDTFLFKGKWEKATIVNEPIKVKDGKTVPYKVTITRHGPIISEFAKAATGDTALSMRWTALEPSTELEAIIEMNKAQNWQQFEKQLEKFHTPAQNFVFAAKDGTIAYKANGKIPIRAKGDSLLPVPGWTGEYEWTGYIPYDKLPRIVNPASGVISTANNKVIGDSYPYHISHRWAQPYRQMRIQQVLNSESGFTPADFKALQMDTLDLQAEEFVKPLLRVVKTKHKDAVSALETWNYEAKGSLAAPLIFNRWYSAIQDELYRDIPKDALELFGDKYPATDQLLRRALAGKEGRWFTDRGGMEKVVSRAFDKAIAEIEKQQGNDVADWKWGDYHEVVFPHPLSMVSPLDRVFNYKGRLATDGSAVTVRAARNKDDGTVYHGGSWRFVADLSDLTKAYHLVGPGQAGHVMSDYYNNQMEAWVNGDYHETSLTKYRGGTLLLRAK